MASENELLFLDKMLDEAWEKERAAYAETKSMEDGEAADKITEAANDYSSSIVKLIGQIPATTLRGLQVKAKAVSWCHSGDEIKWDAETTDQQVALSILNDLLAIDSKKPSLKLVA